VPHAGTNSPVDVVTVVPNPKKRGAFRVASRTRIRSERLQSPVWSVASDDLQELARRLEVSGLPLEAHVGRISAGIATGRDRIFVRRAADLDGVEEALRYGVIRGRSIRRFEVAPSDEEIVVPYERSGDTLKLVDIRHYRGAESYLRAYGEELRQRHCVRTWNKVWYDLHDPLPAGAFEAPKIVVPDIARESRFAVDDEGRVPLHSVYYATVRRVDPYFLSAVLNSRPAQFLMRLRSPIMKDGFSRYRRQFLASLPVPVCSGTDQCAINDCLADGDITGVSERIEKLFGLSAKDGALITRYLAST
jgi:PAS domain-containing protein